MADTSTTAQAFRELADALEARSDEDVLDIGDAARLLGRPVSTLRYWRKNRTGPVPFKLGRRLVYRRGALRAWLAEQETAGSD